MTKAIIFDLDSCLAAADEVGEQLFAPAFAAIRAANDGSVPEEKLQAAFAERWRHTRDGWFASSNGSPVKVDTLHR